MAIIENPLFLNVRDEMIKIKEECGMSKKLPQKGICPH